MLWVLDLDGVVWLAGAPIPGSPEAIRRLRVAGHRVAFVTNNSGPTLAEHVARLAAAGVDADAGELVTSAQAAASVLAGGTSVAAVGGPGVVEAVRARGLEVVPVTARPGAIVVGRTVNLDFAELTAAASAIRDGARFVATNTDATFPTGHGIEPGAGALIAFLQVASGRAPEVAGKPEPATAALVRARFGDVGLVVGDRPDTDGRFATLLGTRFALVLTGVTRRRDLPVEPAPDVTGDDLGAVVASELRG